MTHPILNMIDELDSGRDSLGGYITLLVEQIERAERFRDFYWRVADISQIDRIARDNFNAIAGRQIEYADELRAELRALIGVDAWRLASALGGQG